MFWDVRSMNSVSTVINFGMLGLLRRLHRLQIQFKIQSEISTGIISPRLDKNRSEEGISNKESQYTPPQQKITNDEIQSAVEKAKTNAKSMMEILGMDELVKKHLKWELPTHYDHEELEDNDMDGVDDDISLEKVDCILPEIVKEVSPNDDVSEDVKVMVKNVLTDM